MIKAPTPAIYPTNCQQKNILSPLRPWHNFLPRSRSPVPKRLGTAAVMHKETCREITKISHEVDKSDKITTAVGAGLNTFITLFSASVPPETSVWIRPWSHGDCLGLGVSKEIEVWNLGGKKKSLSKKVNSQEVLVSLFHFRSRSA